MKTRKQVIVVLTASWQVLCFDHNLQPLWESSLQNEFPGHTVQREVAILVTNHTMLADDRGTVIVGVSMEIEQMSKVGVHFVFFCWERAVPKGVCRQRHLCVPLNVCTRVRLIPLTRSMSSRTKMKHILRQGGVRTLSNEQDQAKRSTTPIRTKRRDPSILAISP